MAQFSYESYSNQQQARRNSNGGPTGPEVHFMGEFLRNDGDVAVIRFPYHSMSDITFETTHSITFPGKKYPSRVRCVGDSCPLCAQGIKLDTRFLAKFIVYVVDDTNGSVKLVNTVWDRPAAFADIDLKNLMQDYGDIADYLFKIKRNGSGTSTRYTISIITNTTVYNPAVYKADFSELNQVDPVRILTRSYAQYEAACNPIAETSEVTDVNDSYDATPANNSVPFEEDRPVVDNRPTYNTPSYNTTPRPAAEEAPQPAPAPTPRRQTRYQF